MHPTSRSKEEERGHGGRLGARLHGRTGRGGEESASGERKGGGEGSASGEWEAGGEEMKKERARLGAAGEGVRRRQRGKRGGGGSEEGEGEGAGGGGDGRRLRGGSGIVRLGSGILLYEANAFPPLD
jgi:hypothetical protein